MKKQWKLASAFLALILILSACAAQPAAPQPSSSAPPASSAEAPASPETTPEPPAAPEPPPAAPETEKTGDIVILYTSDVHCGVDQGFGYAGLEQIRSSLLAAGDEVLLVDDGDNIQGETLGTMTKGEAPIELMNRMGYDAAIPGNHEFDYGMERFLALAEKAEFPYVSCNFNYKGELVFEPYVICERAGKKVAFVGVTTPQTLMSSSPVNFQDESGEYVYGFLQDETGEGVYSAVQAAADAARAEGADTVILLGHLGNEKACEPWTYGDVIPATRGIDAMLDGHSHDTDQVLVKNLDGKEIPRSACGTKLACIGWCRIAANGAVTAGLYRWNNDTPAPVLLGIENDMSRAVAEANDALDGKLNEVVAESAVALTVNDPVETDSNGRPIRMVRRAETNLGDLVADAFRYAGGAEIGIANGGGIRADLAAGKITLRDISKVLPYNNEICVVEVTGRQLLDALEWGARAVPDESGGFLQVSGMSYELDPEIPSPCVSDQNGMCIGIEGVRRVKNVTVGGEPLDPARRYTLAGIDYTLLQHGDGFTCFDGAALLREGVKLDNQALIDYVADALGGVIGEEYESMFGQGRIVIDQPDD